MLRGVYFRDVTQGGHDGERLIPDDAGSAYLPSPGLGAAYGMYAIGPRRRAWRGIVAFLILSLVLLASVAVIHARAPISGDPASAGVSAPSWLVSRPFSAELYPDLAPQCIGGDCHFKTASGIDLEAIRALLGDGFNVHGMRVSDSDRKLRGVAVYVYNDEGDELTIDAVWVPRAPTRWDGEKALLAGGAPASRWVLHTTSGVWLVQATAVGCGGGDREWSTLTRLAVHRIDPATLNL